MTVKRTLCALCAAALMLSCLPLSGCSAAGQYTSVYLDVFDTVMTVTVCAPSRADAEKASAAMHDRALELHRAFDMYHEYDGMNNLCTVNRRAGDGEPVPVGADVLSLLTLGLEWYGRSGGMLNICMGAVLSLWHDARTGATAVPTDARLTEAAAHVIPSLLILDPDAGTVRLTDPAASLDVGAVAKGYAAGVLSALYDELTETCGLTGLLLDLGGNVLARGTRADGSPWTVGVRDPLSDGVADTITVPEGGLTVVTSGTDQRAFTVDGVTYHHIIDPETLYPGTRYASVTVMLPPAAADMADALSTSLFLLSGEDGGTLLSSVGGEALWIFADGTRRATPGWPGEGGEGGGA